MCGFFEYVMFPPKAYTHEQVRAIVQIAQELGESLNACRSRGYRPSTDLYKAMLPYREIFEPVFEGMEEDRTGGIIVRDGLNVFRNHSHQH